MKNNTNPVCLFMNKYRTWFSVSWYTGLCYFSVACRRQRNTMLYTANTITLGLLLTKHNIVGRLQSTSTVHIVWGITHEWRSW